MWLCTASQLGGTWRHGSVAYLAHVQHPAFFSFVYEAVDNEPSLPGRLEVGGLNGCWVRGLETLWQQKGFRRFANLSLKPVFFPRSCLAQCVVLSRLSTKSALQDAPPDFHSQFPASSGSRAGLTGLPFLWACWTVNAGPTPELQREQEDPASVNLWLTQKVGHGLGSRYKD